MLTRAEEIRTLREEAGLTLAELAPTAGISASTLSRYETGDRVMTTEVYGLLLAGVPAAMRAREARVEERQRAMMLGRCGMEVVG